MMEKEILNMSLQKPEEWFNDVHLMKGFANTPKQYGDRMIELNKRLLKFVLQKGVEAESVVSSHEIEEEVRKFRETIEELDKRYKTKIENAEHQQVEIQKLKRKDTMLTNRVKELELENENWTEKSREQEETIIKLKSKLTNLEKIFSQNADLRKTNDETMDYIVKLEERNRNYEEELMIFKRGSKQTMTAAKSMEVSLMNVNTIFAKMKSTFWLYVMKYFKSLKAEFENKMEEFKETQINECKKLLKTQLDQNTKLVNDIFKEKTELEQKYRSLELKVTQLTHQVEGYDSAMQVSTKQSTIKVGLEILTGDVEDRMKQQIDLYEVLTHMTEERVDEWSDIKTMTTLEEIKRFFSEEPPDTIKQHMEDVTALFKNIHVPRIMSETGGSMFGATEREYQKSKATIEDMKTMDGQESEEND